MFRNVFVKIGIGLAILLVVMATAACSGVPAPLQTAFATATPVPTDTPTPAPTAAQKNPGKPNPTRPPAAQIPGALRNLGLEGGVVTANTGTQLSLRLGKTQEQLQVAPNAVVIIPGISNAKVSDVQVGDRIIANVPQTAANTAVTLMLDFPKGYTADNVALGLVQSNTNGTLQVKARKGDEQVTTDDSTFVGMLQDRPKAGTVQDIKRGNAVLVIGQPDGNTLSAQVVLVIDRAALQARRNRNAATPTPNAPTATPAP